MQENVKTRLLIHNYFYNPTDADLFLNMLRLSTNPIKINDTKGNKDFWNYLRTTFIKDYVLNILEISESTYYKIGYYYDNKFTVSISDRTIKRINDLRIIIKDSML